MSQFYTEIYVSIIFQLTKLYLENFYQTSNFLSWSEQTYKTEEMHYKFVYYALSSIFNEHKCLTNVCK